MFRLPFFLLTVLFAPVLGPMSTTIILPAPAGYGTNTLSLEIALNGHSTDPRYYGLSQARQDNDVPINAAIAAAHQSGVGLVKIPQGTYPVSATVYDVDSVRIEGVGRGATGVMNTTLIASSKFPANTVMAQIGDHTTGITGNVFGGGFAEMSFNCNSIPGCSGLLNDAGEEETRNTDVSFLFFSRYGYKIAGTNIPATGAAQNNGPDIGLEFLPGSASNANTVDVILQNVANYRGLFGASLVNGNGPGNLDTCMQVSGQNINIIGLHLEFCGVGVELGPPGTVGANQVFISGTTNTLGGNGMSKGPTIKIDANSLNQPNVTITGTNGWIEDDTRGGAPVWSNFYAVSQLNGRSTVLSDGPFEIQSDAVIHGSPYFDGSLRLGPGAGVTVNGVAGITGTYSASCTMTYAGGVATAATCPAR